MWLQGFLLAAGEGFEPSHTESESAVLPLHNPAVFLTNDNHYTDFPPFVNTFLRNCQNGVPPPAAGTGRGFSGVLQILAHEVLAQGLVQRREDYKDHGQINSYEATVICSRIEIRICKRIIEQLCGSIDAVDGYAADEMYDKAQNTTQYATQENTASPAAPQRWSQPALKAKR